MYQKTMKFKNYFFIFILLCSKQLFACDLTIHHIKAESEKDQRHQYFIDLLRLALEKTTDSEGCYNLQVLKEPMYQARALKSLNADYGVDVVWSMTSKQREAQFTAIRIPLLKGLLGYRIFIIRQADEARFAAIQTLEELQTLLAGQGRGWPDTQILRANNIKVMEGGAYDGLFSMLQRKRFDYFPRGVSEPWVELLAHPDKSLMIEKNLLLHYIAPVYFFVGKHNVSLAKRLEKGLLSAIKDGSFDRLFKNHPANKEIFSQSNLATRKTFELANPFLPENTPIENKSLWHMP